MLIGVISDTHGGLPQAALQVFSGCDWILHCGDIGNNAQWILWELEAVAPVLAVLGNCDYDYFGPSVRNTAAPILGGVQFKIAHKREQTLLAEPGTRAFVFGHSHRPCVEWQGEGEERRLYFNPGSACEPRGAFAPSVGIIEADEGRILDARIVELQ